VVYSKTKMIFQSSQRACDRLGFLFKKVTLIVHRVPDTGDGVKTYAFASAFPD